jgi:uncharacterized protein (DUF362 family)
MRTAIEPPVTPATASILEGVGFAFSEPMSGFVGVGETDPRTGVARGRDANTTLRFDVTVKIQDLRRFLHDPGHTAELAGTVTCPALGGTFPVRNGRFNLFAVTAPAGMRQMIYCFGFTAADGADYYLYGHKEISDDPGQVDVVEDMTRLFTTLHRGQDENAPIYAAGELYFHLRDTPALVRSMQVKGAGSWQQRIAAYTAFASFAWGALRDEYLQDLRIFYDTQYENLVLTGVSVDSQQELFFVSGTHDRGFPWGDNEIFWDVLLVIRDTSGHYRRFCITDRILEGLELDVEKGAYSYRGPVWELEAGESASFSQMRRGTVAGTQRQAQFTIQMEATTGGTVVLPFPLPGKRIKRLSHRLAKALRERLPGERPLGIHITPHWVRLRSGEFHVDGPEPLTIQLDPQRSFGEAEIGVFRNLKEPTLLYSYFCALRTSDQSACVQIQPRTLRNEAQHWGKDRLEALIGDLISRTASQEFVVSRDVFTQRPIRPAGKPEQRALPFRLTRKPILEVSNDHFPTAVFQRRIVEVEDENGHCWRALEEAMSTLRCEPIDSKKQVTVACCGGADRLEALDSVLEATGFDTLIDQAWRASQKPKDDFVIAIKPNFMFAYDRRDRSTYTDPLLVGALSRHLFSLGFSRILVVEAQCTYGEYFDKRSVREMATYLGYDEAAGYRVVDMTEDATESEHLGPHLGYHPVSTAWKQADFRISFAKNKTHSYSCYTLTLKNIYGALPMKFKYKEYHCKRDIYHTTIEYLTAFPVHYGLVDGWLSADGPFGIFADPIPNETRTIIGGADLVAVDWVGATKMGIHPMVSPYMQLAVKAFGKPEIRFVGDATPYRPWLNVPSALPLLTHKGMDFNYHFGNLLYSISAQMDETHFRHKDHSWHIRLLRRLTVPLRRTFFLRTGENPSWTNRLVSRILFRMGY